MARLHHVSREQLLALRPSLQGPRVGEASWKAAHPEGPDAALPAWFSLTPRSPSIDSRVGGSDVELTATLETFGGVTGPRVAALERIGAAEPPAVVLGGNPVPPGTPAGPVEARTRQCTVRLRLLAEGVPRGRQCLVLLAVCALGSGEHRVQLLLGEATLAEDVIHGEDRLAVLLDVPNDGHLQVDLWLRLCASDAGAQLGVRGAQGHLL
ncbi:MAG: hypothetical protein KDK70_25280 [Myxococcales bacterium]|nr:hypothetical protein [Myxococcales bacterium]